MRNCDIIATKMEISRLVENKRNPRKISESGLQTLMKSIEEFPEMMLVRPIVVNKDYVVLGGNMRLRALQMLGYDRIPDEWVKIANNLSAKECDYFIIEDNLNVGDWDYSLLADEYTQDELADWTGGVLELKDFDLTETDEQEKEATLKECPFCGFKWK